MNYIEKGIGLHEKIAAAGFGLHQIDQVWMVTSGSEAEVQAIIDGYTSDEARAPVIAKVKAKARDLILAFLPDWKQSNLNARMNELNLERAFREWTDAEMAEISAMQSLWDRAKLIRQASDVHEANLTAFKDDFASINAYDTEAGWPE